DSRPVVSLLAASAVLRIIALAVWRPVILNQDSGEYLDGARRWVMFYDRPAGTGFFFRTVLTWTDDLFAIVVVQSGIGVASGLVAFQVGRRLGLRNNVAW